MPADVEVFSGPNCTHCEAAKKLLNDNNVEFIERKIDDLRIRASDGRPPFA